MILVVAAGAGMSGRQPCSASGQLSGALQAVDSGSQPTSNHANIVATLAAGAGVLI
ncbi:MAG: hypothetical protein WCZ02_06230 [Lysobacterales bacterium]